MTSVASMSLLLMLIIVTLTSQNGSHAVMIATTDVSEDLLSDTDHPCSRNCSSDPNARICFYHFRAEYYTTLSKACYQCSVTPSDCDRHHCVAADGVKKPIVTVNRRMPGPSIQVCQGDEIMVELENGMASDSTTIHWHGLHMVGTPYMDGVPHLTQCPVLPSSTFRYHFLADKTGTHYWHSHSGFQRADGMFGSLTVRSGTDPLLPLYDVDHYSHVLLLTDWLEKLAIEKFVFHHFSEHDNKPYNILVNGRGYIQSQLVYQGAHPPLSAITVTKGLRHRIRTISNSIQNCPIEVSVDGHTLLMIAKDGAPLEPISVESFVIYGGERWDFVLDANKQVGNYWIKFHGLLDCDSRFKSAYQVAVLRYKGAPDQLPSPLSEVSWSSTKREGFQVNTLNKAPGTDMFKTSAEIHSMKADTDQYSAPPDYSFWFDFDFHAIDNKLYNDPKYYPFYGVPKEQRLFMPQLNYITLKFPHSPPLSQPNDIPASLYCNQFNPPKVSKGSNCSTEFCTCLHMHEVEKNSLVEVILVDKGFTYYANHPFHLHGHAFAVLGMERLGENTTLEAVQKLEREGRLMRNFDSPPIMDTVTVPDGGYTVIRFRATNPGFWLFHCHITFHMEVGMGLVFHVGDQSMVPPVPEYFPRCGNFQPPSSQESLQKSIVDWLNQNGDKDSALAISSLPKVPSTFFVSVSNGSAVVGPSYSVAPEQSSSAIRTKNSVCLSLIPVIVWLIQSRSSGLFLSSKMIT